MKSSLERFKKEIDQIREYIKHIQYLNEFHDYYNTLKGENNIQIEELIEKFVTHYRLFKTDKKIFEYKAVIISLYGILERSIDSWIKEYIAELSNIISEYNNIDEKIRETHFELSLRLISNIMTREAVKYQHLNKEEILRKLNNCVTNSDNYKINAEAFVLLSGNLKHKKIVELFQKIDIDLNKGLKKNETLNNHIQKEQGIKNIENLHTETLYNKINELVERRNEIAHGSEAIDNILDFSEIEKYIQFIENYCQAIFEILEKKLIEQDCGHNFQKIENIINIYNNKILAFEVEKHKIKVGDTIIMKNKKDEFFYKKILKIEKDNIPHEEIEIKNKTKIAIELSPGSPKIKNTQAFFIKKR